MKQCGTGQCAVRTVVNSEVELNMVVDVDGIVTAGTDDTCRDCHAALITKFATNNLGEKSWNAASAFER